MNTIDLLNLGVDPDDLLPDPTRCHGPAYPDSHGCGRFARDGMCDRCQEETRRHWHVDEALQREWEDAQIVKLQEQEAAAYAAEMAAHPDITCECAWCATWILCAWDGWSYTCKDRAACDARILGAPEYHVVGQPEEKE